MQTITLNADEASRRVRIIADENDKVKAATAEVKEAFQEAYEESDLGFLNAIATGFGEIQSQIGRVAECTTNLQSGLTRYIGEVAEYSEDTSGLYN